MPHGWRPGGTANRPMPIIEPPANSEHLLQGDVLQGVRLFATERSWGERGGESVKAPHNLCLVLSRPCVVRHRRNIVVAGIDKYPDSVPKGISSFKEVREFLIGMRDGIGAPNVFYLGQLPGMKGRFCTRLDAICCIEVPVEEWDLLPFLQRRRIGSLNADFARDLHLRLFMAFASLGFNDQSWLPDEDLKWLVDVGQGEVKQADAELQKAIGEKAGRDAEGKEYAGDKIEKLENRLASLTNAVEPYANEWLLREQVVSGTNPRNP